MLSRVAGSLYWMGRYLERGENVTRLLAVTSDFAIEFGGLDEALAKAEWDDLVRALPGATIPEIEFSPERGLTVPYVNALLLDDANPLSATRSGARARTRARSARRSRRKSSRTSTRRFARSRITAARASTTPRSAPRSSPTPTARSSPRSARSSTR